jgi:hypothetical protein
MIIIKIITHYNFLLGKHINNDYELLYSKTKRKYQKRKKSEI